MPKQIEWPNLARKLVEAAEAHADATGESDFIQGDLEILLGVAMHVMSPTARRQFWHHQEVDQFVDLPEYAKLMRQQRVRHRGRK